MILFGESGCEIVWFEMRSKAQSAAEVSYCWDFFLFCFVIVVLVGFSSRTLFISS